MDAGPMRLDLVRASQTVAALRPEGWQQSDGISRSDDASEFDFTPADWLERRASDGYFHLGDLTLSLRWDGSDGWRHYSTATARQPVEPLPSPPPALAAADLAPTLPPDLPLRVRRYWESLGDHLALRFELHNAGTAPVEIGALGIPMVFNNILSGRTLDEAHAVASFHDPYIGRDAGYLQVTRLSGHGPTLLVVPLGDTPFEAYNPLLGDPTPRSVTFEGFYEWMAHSRAYAEDEWSEADAWNPPTSATLAPGETRSYGVRFLLADEIRAIEPTLLADGRPVAVGVPGYVVPMDIEARLFLKHAAGVQSLEVEPPGALTITPSAEPGGALAVAAADPSESGWNAYDVRGRSWGRARLTVTYQDGLQQTIHYKVIKPAAEAVADLGRFLTTEQWFEVPDDPFGRSPSVISYDYDERRQVTEDNRAWIAGIGDEGGSGSWLAAIMKQLVQPDPGELAKMQRFVDEVVWGGLQYAEGELAYGVRKSMFYYQPDEMPEGTYSEDVRYGGWSSWDREHAMTVVRSYNYPHVAALHWALYRLARNQEGLVTNHSWEWYLDRAWRTAEAMVEHAGHYSQFGQMGGTVFLLILLDLQREGWTGQAAALEATMRARAEVWRELGYPYGSEMPWDSTGQEEVYAWCRYFGFDAKALVTLNAILAYTPAVPHWGYNGSARRYWDFQYAGKLRRVERQLHHYGSALNTIPVLSEYRDHPDDLYLLRVGYAGMMGGIANITQDGFGPSAFHAYPSTLRIDGYSGDYGPGFLGHAINTGTYVVSDPEFGWLAFGGNLSGGDDSIRVTPLDAARSRLYLAPLGLWLTLDAGTFEAVELSADGVRVTLSPASAAVPNARLRVEQPTSVDGVGRIGPASSYEVERGAYVVPLGDRPTVVVLGGVTPGAQDAGCVQPVRTVAQLDSAVVATRSLLEAQPASADLRCRMGALRMQGGHYEEADSMLASLLADDPDQLDALLTQAVLRRRQHRFEDAGRILSHADERAGAYSETSQLANQRHDFHLLRGRLALDAMNIAKADSIYTGILQSDPNLAEARLGAAEIAFWQHRSNDARELLQGALSIDPQLSAAHLLAARIHREAQENAEWRASVHRAVEVDSLFANGHAQLATVFRNDSAIAEAYHHAHFAIDLDPYAQGAHSYLGNGGSLLGYDSVPADPAEFDGRVGELLALGDEHLLTRRYEEAMGPFQEVVALDPGNVVALMGIGTAHYQLGDYEAALEWFERILADHPGYGLAHYGVAMVLGRMRDRVIVGLDEMRKVFAGRDAPEPEGLREVFPDYGRLDEELQKIVRLSVEPFSNFLPAMADRGATFHLLPFHKLLWQSPDKESNRGRYTFDLRLWDDVKGQGGFHAVGGEEWVRGVRYQRWNVITHEFTHQVHQMLPDDLREEISRLFEVAKAERRTLDYYADFNEMEYFAQAAEAFISEVKFIDQRGTSGHTRALLAEKDPALFEFLSRVNERLAGAQPARHQERGHEQRR